MLQALICDNITCKELALHAPLTDDEQFVSAFINTLHSNVKNRSDTLAMLQVLLVWIQDCPVFASELLGGNLIFLFEMANSISDKVVQGMATLAIGTCLAALAMAGLFMSNLLKASNSEWPNTSSVAFLGGVASLHGSSCCIPKNVGDLGLGSCNNSVSLVRSMYTQ